MDPESLALANAAVGNALGAAAIERYGAITLRALEDAIVADENGTLTVLAAGATVQLDWDGTRRVGYAAMDGGIDVPSVLGGCGTMLSLGRGGHHGRPLRRGDVLTLGASRDRAERRALPRDETPIRVTLGPDLDRLEANAGERLLSTPWALDVRSDRTGTRLVGPPIAHRAGARAMTMPMIEGAIECPPDSAPIVLGPEHPTTGGYPVVAVVVEADLARFHRMRLGAEVRFVASRGGG